MRKKHCKFKKLFKIILKYLTFNLFDNSDGLGSQLTDSGEIISPEGHSEVKSKMASV